MPKSDPYEPWFHKGARLWCKKIAGRFHYLDADYRTAKRKLRRLVREMAKARSGAVDWLHAPLGQLCDEFLDDVQARRAAETYVAYRHRLQRALEVIGPGTPIASLRRFHLNQIERRYLPQHSPTTVRDTITTLQTALNWAVAQELLEDNPLRGYVKPRARQRSRIVLPEEFQALLRALPRNPRFRRVLVALRLTGCRPKEIRTLTWEMVDLEQRLWVLPKHKTVTTQRRPKPRIIPLPHVVFQLTRWLYERKPEGEPHVFLNMRGRPYTKNAFVHTMAQARKRAGIELKADEQLVLYSVRHTFGTEATGKVSDMELAELMGHTSTETTRRYVHLNSSRLHDIQRRVQGQENA